MTKAELHRLVDDLPEGAVDGAAVQLRGIREGRVDPDQAWFWTPEWLAGELEADEDLAKGRIDQFQDEDSFLAALEADEDRSEP